MPAAKQQNTKAVLKQYLRPDPSGLVWRGTYDVPPCNFHRKGKANMESKNKIIDLTGQVFGKWRVLRCLGKVRGGRKFYHLCQCECGTQRAVGTNSLRYGDSKSCGCQSLTNALGKRFGMLVVLRFVSRIKGRSHWWCKCDCGVETEVSLVRLTKSRPKGIVSCGCINSKRISEMNRLPKGVAALNSLYIHYKNSAKDRNLSFKLTKEEFIELTQSLCHYCGVSPSQECKGRNHGSYMYNGIDREDSKKGYTIENCVPCCKTCNFAKNNLSLEEFLAWIDRLVKFRTQQKPESPATVQGNE